MNSNNIEAQVSLKDVILKLQEWLNYLRLKISTIIIFAIIGGIGGAVYSLSKKAVYVAEVTYVLEGESRSSNQYANLAALAGISLGSGGSSLFQGENIKDLMRSRLMIEQTLFSSLPRRYSGRTLLDLYLHFSGLRSRWKKSGSELAKVSFSEHKIGKDSVQDAIVSKIVKDISSNLLTFEKEGTKSALSIVVVKSENELFSKFFAEKLVENVGKFYVETKTNKSRVTLSLLQHQADSVRKVLNTAIGGVAEFNQSVPNANPALSTIKVPSQRRQIDVQSNTAIFGELLKNIEIARMTLRNETPLFQIVDKPMFPLETQRIGLVRGVILGALVFTIVSMFILLIRRLYYEIMY